MTNSATPVRRLTPALFDKVVTLCHASHPSPEVARKLGLALCKVGDGTLLYLGRRLLYAHVHFTVTAPPAVGAADRYAQQYDENALLSDNVALTLLNYSPGGFGCGVLEHIKMLSVGFTSYAGRRVQDCAKWQDQLARILFCASKLPKLSFLQVNSIEPGLDAAFLTLLVRSQLLFPSVTHISVGTVPTTEAEKRASAFLRGVKYSSAIEVMRSFPALSSFAVMSNRPLFKPRIKAKSDDETTPSKAPPVAIVVIHSRRLDTFTEFVEHVHATLSTITMRSAGSTSSDTGEVGGVCPHKLEVELEALNMLLIHHDWGEGVSLRRDAKGVTSNDSFASRHGARLREFLDCIPALRHCQIVSPNAPAPSAPRSHSDSMTSASSPFFLNAVSPSLSSLDISPNTLPSVEALCTWVTRQSGLGTLGITSALPSPAAREMLQRACNTKRVRLSVDARAAYEPYEHTDPFFGGAGSGLVREGHRRVDELKDDNAIGGMRPDPEHTDFDRIANAIREQACVQLGGGATACLVS